MALLNCNRSPSAKAGWFSGIRMKVFAVLALVVTARVLVGQTQPADNPVPEDKDTQGYKFQIPNGTLRKNKTLVGKEQTTVRAILTGTSSMANPADRTRFRAYFREYLFP